MAFSTIAIPKKVLGSLRNIPRDIFFSLEGFIPAVGVINRIFLREDYSGIGLDCSVINTAAAVGNATITFDKNKIVTLAPGQIFTLDNVLFALIEIQRAGAGAIVVDVVGAGVSEALIEVL